jgi:hypothetical protein
MAVISVSIIESAEQLVAGFPKTISLSSNVPATIFYTTDGTEPTTMSSVYTSAIVLPRDTLEFILKVFATNGVDSSPVITSIYVTDILNNTRVAHATLGDLGNNAPQSLYPFGSSSPAVEADYQTNANAGTTVYNPEKPLVPFGYDASGNEVGANQPIDNYLNVYSTTDSQNKTTFGVGNLPGKVTVVGRRMPLEYRPQESSRASGLFDAKAMVIFQDSTNEDPTNPVQLNPQSFSLENLEVARDGSPLRATALDTPTITGSYLRSHYNPRTQMITAYYRDSATNRWIISSTPYTPKQSDPGNLSGMVFSRNDQGAGKVYGWNLFRYRTLT